MSRVTYTLKEPNGRIFRVVGTAVAIAEARAEANAKLALTVGAAVSASESTSIAAVPGGAAGSYSDIQVTLKLGTRFANVHIENVADSFAELDPDTNPTGRVDLAALAAFAAAYRDGAGTGGWAVHEAHYVR